MRSCVRVWSFIRDTLSHAHPSPGHQHVPLLNLIIKTHYRCPSVTPCAILGTTILSHNGANGPDLREKELIRLCAIVRHDVHNWTLMVLATLPTRPHIKMGYPSSRTCTSQLRTTWSSKQALARCRRHPWLLGHRLVAFQRTPRTRLEPTWTWLAQLLFLSISIHEGLSETRLSWSSSTWACDRSNSAFVSSVIMFTSIGFAMGRQWEVTQDVTEKWSQRETGWFGDRYRLTEWLGWHPKITTIKSSLSNFVESSTRCWHSITNLFLVTHVSLKKKSLYDFSITDMLGTFGDTPVCKFVGCASDVKVTSITFLFDGTFLRSGLKRSLQMKKVRNWVRCVNSVYSWCFVQ